MKLESTRVGPGTVPGQKWRTADYQLPPLDFNAGVAISSLVNFASQRRTASLVDSTGPSMIVAGL